MFESILQGESDEVLFCLQNGVRLVDVCNAMAEKYDVELHQSKDQGNSSVIIVKKLKK